MILGLDMISSVLTNVLPAKSSFEYLKINGNLVIDALSVSKVDITDNEILNHFDDITPPEFDNNSVLVGNFDNNLEAGSLITSVPYPLSKYIIRRKEVGSSLNPVLVELNYDPDLSTYIDYTAKNKTNYTYGVYPLYSDDTTTGRIEGRGLEGNSSIDFYAYILTDISTYPPVQYVFTMDVELSDIEVIDDYKVYENYTQFPVVHFGQTQYKKMSLKTIPYRYEEGQGNSGYVIDKDVLDDVINFLHNGNEKLLRLPSSEVIKVVTSEASYKYEDAIGDQPYRITFTMTEVGEV